MVRRNAIDLLELRQLLSRQPTYESAARIDRLRYSLLARIDIGVGALLPLNGEVYSKPAKCDVAACFLPTEMTPAIATAVFASDIPRGPREAADRTAAMLASSVEGSPSHFGFRPPFLACYVDSSAWQTVLAVQNPSASTGAIDEPTATATATVFRGIMSGTWNGVYGDSRMPVPAHEAMRMQIARDANARVRAAQQLAMQSQQAALARQRQTQARQQAVQHAQQQKQMQQQQQHVQQHDPAQQRGMKVEPAAMHFQQQQQHYVPLPQQQYLQPLQQPLHVQPLQQQHVMHGGGAGAFGATPAQSLLPFPRPDQVMPATAPASSITGE